MLNKKFLKKKLFYFHFIYQMTGFKCPVLDFCFFFCCNNRATLKGFE